MMPRRPIVGVVAILFPLALAPSVRGDPIKILGTANIFSAGNNATNLNAWINSSNAGLGTSAPFIDLGGTGSGRTLVFNSVTGEVNIGGGKGLNGPDGFASPTPSPWPAQGGVSGILVDQGAALLGVFTGDTVPSSGAPDPLDFTGNTNFATLSPVLNQLFFIGDGLTGTGTGERQLFLIPDNATRLYLGIADRKTGGTTPGTYNDNKGSFTAYVTINAVPEPSSVLVALAGIGTAAAAFVRRRRPGTRIGAGPA